MIHKLRKSRRTTKLLSAFLAAVIIFTSGGFEVLAADTGSQTAWEAIEVTAAASETVGISGEEDKPEKTSGSTPWSEEKLEVEDAAEEVEKSGSTLGEEEVPEEEPDNLPETEDNTQESEDSDGTPETDETNDGTGDGSLDELTDEVSDEISDELSNETTESDIAEDAEGQEEAPDSSSSSLTASVNIVKEGEYENIKWSIDSNGTLNVTGTGEFASLNTGSYQYRRAPWYDYRYDIKTAVVNVTGMTDASYMFYQFENMTSVDLSGLDTSTVTSMQGMFFHCSSLNTLDLSNFNTSNVTDMSGMFNGITGVTKLDVSHFDTSKVTDMSRMFMSCSGLTSLDVSNFNTSKVTDMTYMFGMCSNLTSLDLSHFDTSNVTDMNNMFQLCGKLTSLNLSKFDTSKVTDMSHMFELCSGLTGLNLSSFNTSNVTDMYGMFRWCSSLTSLDLSGFRTPNVTDMHEMFFDCESLTNLNVSKFDTSKVTNMAGMFSFCRGLTDLDLRNFNTSQVTDMQGMFESSSGLIRLNVSSFDTSNVTRMGAMFRECESLISLDLSNFDTSQITSMSTMFVYCESLKSLDISNFDTTNVTNMHSMFQNCYSLTSLDVGSFDTSNVEDMTSLFNGCKQLSSLDLSYFDTAKVTDMRGMFYECSSLTKLDLSSFHTTNVIYMSYMFYGCGKLTGLDLSSFNTSNVTEMEEMFKDCYELTSLNVSSFDTSKVENMSSMFESCSKLTSLDLSSFNTANVTTMGRMFSECTNLKNIDVSSFDTSRVTAINSMFANCFALTSLDLSNFDLSNVTYATDFTLPSSENFTLIYTPRNLTRNINLPDGYGTGKWYQADGTQVTKLPMNLSYSIALQRDKPPTASSSLTVRKTKTDYVCGEKINVDDITGTFSDGNGMIKTVTDFTTNADEIDMSVPGKKILIVTYGGMTAEIVLNVTYILTDSSVTVTLPDQPLTYSGLPQTPAPVLTILVNGTVTTLQKGSDYQLSYRNNINACENIAGENANVPVIVITGQGDYSGTVTQPFTIEKAQLTIKASDITLIAGDTLPDESTFEYQVAGLFNGDKLLKKPSFTCDVTDMSIPGTYTITPYGADAGSNYKITSYEKGMLTVIESGVYHTVTFDLSGRGSKMIRRGIKAGSLLAEPPAPQDPESTGYVFAGWYKDQTFAAKQKWNFETDTVQADLTLYACWLTMAVGDGNGINLCIQDILPQTYTGSGLKPTVLVYDSDGTTLLKAGKDYTISYHNNTETDDLKFAGSTIPKGGTGTILPDGSIDSSTGFHEALAYVKVKGKGNYTGTLCKNFHIEQASVSDGNGIAPGITLKYTESLVCNDKKEQSPFTSIKYKKAMTAGKDYTVTLSAETGEEWQQSNDGKTLPKIPKGYYGTFKMTIEGIGNYSGIVEKTIFVAADKNHLMKNAGVTLGKNQKQITNVTKEDLEKGIKLTPAYYDAADKKYYRLDENGELTGEPMDKIDDVFIVKCGSTYLKYGKDYVIDEIDGYVGNHAIGTAAMILQGIGEYTGTKSISFKITGTAFQNITVEGLTSDVPFTGKAVIQNDVILTNGKAETDADYKKFTYGSDYYITYKNNLKKGTATMTFTAYPESGYSGNFKKTFKITAQSLREVSFDEAGIKEIEEDAVKNTKSIQWSDNAPATYSKNGATLSFTLKNAEGMELKQGTDYTVSYKNNKAVTEDNTNIPVNKQSTLTIKGKGNYAGTLTVTFPIQKAPISVLQNPNLTITADAVYYDGKKENYTAKLKVTDAKKTLSAGENKDYVITEYKNNDKASIEEYLNLLKAGTVVSGEDLDNKKPQVLISGKNNYEGNTTLYFDVYDTKINNNNLYIVISDEPDGITYTGDQLTPEIAVYYSTDTKKVKAAKQDKERDGRKLTDTGNGGYGLTRLKNGLDYTLTWGSNIAAGKNKGSVTVTGTGLYGGKVTEKFTIVNKDIYPLR